MRNIEITVSFENRNKDFCLVVKEKQASCVGGALGRIVAMTAAAEDGFPSCILNRVIESAHNECNTDHYIDPLQALADAVTEGDLQNVESMDLAYFLRKLTPKDIESFLAKV